MVSIYSSLLILGRGIGLVMFQNNALSGLLMLIQAPKLAFEKELYEFVKKEQERIDSIIDAK